MDYEDLLYDIWLFLFIFINSLKAFYNLDIFSLITAVSIAMNLAIEINKKMKISSEISPIKVSNLGCKKEISTQTSSIDLKNKASQTDEVEAPKKKEKGSQTLPQVFETKANQTENKTVSSPIKQQEEKEKRLIQEVREEATENEAPISIKLPLQENQYTIDEYFTLSSLSVKPSSSIEPELKKKKNGWKKFKKSVKKISQPHKYFQNK